MTFCYDIHTFFRIELINIYTTEFFLFDFCIRNYFILQECTELIKSHNRDRFLYIIIKVYTTVFHNVNKNNSFLSSKSAFYYFWMIK